MIGFLFVPNPGYWKDEAFKLGDRIALLDGGHIVQIGTARKFVATPASITSPISSPT